METMDEVLKLKQTVIDNNFCIGCGICAIKAGSPFTIKLNEYGNYVAELDGNYKSDFSVNVLETCPFSNESKNESELGDVLFPTNTKDSRIGNYLKSFAGYVRFDSFREKGSSGGLGKWLGYILLKERLIDYFIQVAPNSSGLSDRALFEYKVFTKEEEVISGSKSSYYPTTLENVLEVIKNKSGRYAITGVPCFIKAIRLLCLEDSVFSSRIKFTLGIVCGGMKSANQAKMIGWQMGVRPENLVAIDFRRKDLTLPASNKIYQVWSNLDNRLRIRKSSKIFGASYGYGLFKPKACDYCDDVVGETADISIGDAWLPDYVKDSKGTSILVVRNKVILDLIEKYRNIGHLVLDEVSSDDVALSQDGGFRHRREGLSYRLGKMVEAKKWYPEKRVSPNEFVLSEKRRRIYSLREELADKSHIYFLEAILKNNLGYFTKKIAPTIREYNRIAFGTFFERAYKKIKRLGLRVIGKVF